MKKFKQFKNDKQSRLVTVLKDFTRDPDAAGFILSNMQLQFECVPNLEKPDDVVMIISFLGTMNVNGASACEKHTEDTQALPFPPNIPSEMAAYCSMIMLDHFATIFGTLDQDCQRQYKELAKDSSYKPGAKSNFIKSECHGRDKGDQKWARERVPPRGVSGNA